MGECLRLEGDEVVLVSRLVVTAGLSLCHGLDLGLDLGFKGCRFGLRVCC